VAAGAQVERDLASSTAEAAGADKPKLRTRQYRRFARRLLSESFAAIMERMAQESIGGSLAHTRYLFELGGLTEELRNEGQAKGEPNLGELMREEIKRQRAAAAAAAAKPGSGDMGTRDERGDDIAGQEMAEREIAGRDVPGRDAIGREGDDEGNDDFYG